MGADLKPMNKEEGDERARFVLIDKLYELEVPRYATNGLGQGSKVPRCGHFENEMTGTSYFVLPVPDIVRLWLQPQVPELTLAAMGMEAPRILHHWARWQRRILGREKVVRSEAFKKFDPVPWLNATIADTADAFYLRRVDVKEGELRPLRPGLPREGRQVDLDQTNERFLNVGPLWIPTGARVVVKLDSPSWAARRGCRGTENWTEVGYALEDIQPWQVGLVALTNRAMVSLSLPELEFLRGMEDPERRLQLRNGAIITVLQLPTNVSIAGSMRYTHELFLNPIRVQAPMTERGRAIYNQRVCEHEMRAWTVRIPNAEWANPTRPDVSVATDVRTVCSPICDQGFLVVGEYLPDNVLHAIIDEMYPADDPFWRVFPMDRKGLGWCKSLNQREDP